MPPAPTLREELRELERKWVQITDRPGTPRSLMDVIEYSLGSQRKAEVYVNRLLRYFLDGEEPHGMRTEFLEAVLDGLPHGCDFREDTHDLSDVEVAEQVRVREWADADEDREPVTTGEVDLVVEAPNEWFVLIELKFSAGENNLRGDGPSQTETYFRATHVGDRPKDEYESGSYYLYLHPRDEPTANDPHFANWTWKEFTDDVLEDVLAENAPRYPQRTVAQLRELVDDVQEITGMTDQQTTEREKIELYLDHYDAINDVRDTFDDRWEAFTESWAARLGTALETSELPEADHVRFEVRNTEDRLGEEYDGDRWTFLEANSERPERSVEPARWTFRAKDSDWGHVFADGWWRPTDDVESTLVTRDENRDDIRISFIHRLERNRDLAVGERTLKFYFRNCGSNDRAFRERFNERFDDRREEIASALPGSAELTGQRRNLVAATYDIEVEDHDDFFEAYVAALKQAFVEHAVANEELTRLIGDAYDEAVEMYE